MLSFLDVIVIEHQLTVPPAKLGPYPPTNAQCGMKWNGGCKVQQEKDKTCCSSLQEEKYESQLGSSMLHV